MVWIVFPRSWRALPNNPPWLPLEEIEKLDKELVSRTGEPYLLRDRTLLESALARPKNMHAFGGEDDPVVLAIGLFAGIVQNNPFMQGNKRTGFAAAAMFLEINNVRFALDDKVECAWPLPNIGSLKVAWSG
jgi:death on curing protein